LVAEALFGPALAEEQVATCSFVRNAFQGFFLAPMLVHNSLVSKEKLMSNVVNALKERYPYSDVIVRTRWSFREKMIAAAQAVQSCGPINSYVSVEPFVMGGYNEPIVMAWTGFIQGESLSLSADGTVCEPYELFLQPGVNPFIIDNLCETLNLLN
jgi:cystathionine beta-lyase family protein involved in aluminum resistance